MERIFATSLSMRLRLIWVLGNQSFSGCFTLSQGVILWYWEEDSLESMECFPSCHRCFLRPSKSPGWCYRLCYGSSGEICYLPLWQTRDKTCNLSDINEARQYLFCQKTLDWENPGHLKNPSYQSSSPSADTTSRVPGLLHLGPGTCHLWTLSLTWINLTPSMYK